MKPLSTILVMTLTIAGCDSKTETEQPASTDHQTRYSNQVKYHQEQLDTASKTKNELTINAAEGAAKSFLKDNPVQADNWQASITGINIDGDSIIVNAQHKTHSYTMRIVDTAAKTWAGTLRNGDQVAFSGNIGKEQSVTTAGGLRNPEFKFFPTSIRRATETISQTQSDSAISAAMKSDEAKEQRSTLIAYINELCQDATKAKAFNKRSVDFSLWKLSIKQIDEHTWRYTNDVSGSNAFGATLSHRVICTVKTRIGPKGSLQARVQDLNISQ